MCTDKLSASQELLRLSQTSCDDNDEYEPICTQVVNAISSQEAYDALQFFETLPSQESQRSMLCSQRDELITADDEDSIMTVMPHEDSDHDDSDDKSFIPNEDSDHNDSHHKSLQCRRCSSGPPSPQIIVADKDTNGVKEKKKRGRKKKVWTQEEWKRHLATKKEKNRLAAKRLREKKSSEVQNYEEEERKYEKKVKVHRMLADHLSTKVEQLRKRLHDMANDSKSLDSKVHAFKSKLEVSNAT